MNWETYVAFGDSITIGARSYLGYPEMVAMFLEERLAKKWNVINHAVSGYNAISLARDINSHFSNLQIHRPNIVSVMIGTNDIKEGVPIEYYRIALNQIITKAKLISENNKVVLFYIPNFPEGVMYPYTFEMNVMVDAYNEVITQMAQENGIQTLGFELDENDFFDGVHLNDKGNLKVAKAIALFVLRERGLNTFKNDKI